MRELIVDSFAGGGGASTGIEMALGRSPDYAINHDDLALAMHQANHPETVHLSNNIWKVNPDDVAPGQPIGLLWASPDCTHHSKAKGGVPVRSERRNSRDLGWIVVLWAERRRPRVIILENVEEWQAWGPLVLGEDGQLRPCPERKGETFKLWVRKLRRLGYKVEWRELRACDYGAPTIRKRLLLIARRDGEPIVWPKPTHGAPTDPDVLAGIKQPWRTAADIIDWSLPCPSIFMTREQARAYTLATGIRVNRPLAENTMKRIAKGVRRYVIETTRPFLVPRYGERDGQEPRTRSVDEPLATVVPTGNGASLVSPFVANLTHQGGERVEGLDQPLRTVTGAQRGEKALVAPFVSYAQHGGNVRSAGDPLHTVTASTKDNNQVVAAHLAKFRGDSGGVSLEDPAPTVTANSYVTRPGGAPPLGVVAAFLAQNNYEEPGHHPGEPVSTVVSKGCTQSLVAAHLMNMKGSERRDSAAGEPAPTVCAGGWHQAEVRAFLLKYYGNETEGHRIAAPCGTATTKDRMSLVVIDGEPFEIVDIGMRMLSPRELFRAQGFPDSYGIEAGVMPDGTRVPLTKTAAIRMCGNSVCPPLAAALVAANCADMAEGLVPMEAAE